MTLDTTTAAPTVTPDEHTLRCESAVEGVDPRTVKRRLRGEPVRGLAGARADRVLARLGIPAPRRVA